MTKVQLNISAAEKNASAAEANRKIFRQHKVLVMNLIGSPGCGKTSILEYTARHCRGRCAVIVGDVKTALDADRILDCDVAAYPVETGGGCHLNAEHVGAALENVDLSGIDYLFIENVGNLVCPSTFDLGEDSKIGVLSIPEGDEKVRKYPALFSRTDIVFINKTDLLPYCNYNIAGVEKDCSTARAGVRIFKVSATTGEGLGDWIAFLEDCKPDSGLPA